MNGSLQAIPPASMTGVVVRLVHAALLLQGGGAMAREFWSGHPLEFEGAILHGADLHARLWDERAVYPLDWVLSVFDSLESFCLRHGLDHLAFLETRMLGLNGGCLLHPRSCLLFAGEYLGDLLRTPDVHLTTLRLLESASAQIATGVRLRLLRHERDGERLKAWIALDVLDDRLDVHGSDLCSWVAIALAHCPRRLGASAFDPVRVLADTRSIDSVVESAHRGEAPERRGDEWRTSGGVLARRVDFQTWMTDQRLPLPESCTASVGETFLLESDWACTQRGRRVLHRGTLHGAPFGLFLVQWHLDDASPAEAALRVMIREALDGGGGGDGGDGWGEAERLHRQLLENDQHKLRFVYHASDETISCNGAHLLRGVPAKILQKVLIAHTITGRTLFEHREFRRDPDLKLDPANPNLESRLRLLSQRLEERLPSVCLVKAGRGRFQFETSVQIAYDEEGLAVT